MTDWDELSPLEIDNQRLRADCAKLETAHGQNMREIDRLRAELAAAQKWRDDFCMDYRVKCDEQTKAAEAERDALRAVLAKIRRDYSSAFMPEDAARIDAALKASPGDR